MAQNTFKPSSSSTVVKQLNVWNIQDALRSGQINKELDIKLKILRNQCETSFLTPTTVLGSTPATTVLGSTPATPITASAASTAITTFTAPTKSTAPCKKFRGLCCL